MNKKCDPQVGCHAHSHGDGGIIHELICHFPYSVFSVSAGLLLLTLMQTGIIPTAAEMARYHGLFHSFHYLHIVFAAIGTVITFFRFSSNKLLGLVIGTVSPAIFCVLSDIILPYLGGEVMGVDMHLHICFFCERLNITTFLAVGFLTGLALSKQSDELAENRLLSKYAHFSHIMLSSCASLFYMMSHGFVYTDSNMGLLFLVLLGCVVVPCTLSDIVVPMWVARLRNNNERYSS